MCKPFLGIDKKTESAILKMLGYDKGGENWSKKKVIYFRNDN